MILKRMFILFLPPLLMLVSCGGGKPEEEKSGPTGQKWKLVWSDEFDYRGAPDQGKWDFDTGAHGWGNSELQSYTTDRTNSLVKNGKLHIRAVRTGKNSWTSARLKTQGLSSWKYGRIEIRARQPKGIGTWSALWMYPEKENYGGWPKSGEIDIAEHVGFTEGVIHGTIHCDAYNHMKDNYKQKTVTYEDAVRKFHVYALEWEEDIIRWYVDDREYFSYAKEENASFREWPFDQPFYLIMNLAIGGTWGGKEGIDKKMEEAVMEIDYVRVYQAAD